MAPVPDDYATVDDLRERVAELDAEVARLSEENAGLRAEVERSHVSRETTRRRGPRS